MVIQMSWFFLDGFEGERPVFVANANLVTQLVHICFGLAEAKVLGFTGAYCLIALWTLESLNFDYTGCVYFEDWD